MRHSRFLLMTLCALMLVVSIPGVYAVWTYFNPPDDVNEDITPSMGTWDYSYTIRFVNDEHEYASVTIEDNSSEVTIADLQEATTAKNGIETAMGEGYEVEYWINAGSTPVPSIPAGNTEDVTLYPSFKNRYSAIFVDQAGNILDWCLFVAQGDGANVTALALEIKKRETGTEGAIPVVKDCVFDYWYVRTANTSLSEFDFTSWDGGDITIYPSYKFKGDVNLIPIDSDGDGATDYYEVGGYSADTGEQTLVEIPNEVNGIPVTTINADAFSSYDDLHSVIIPANITSINSQAFTANQGTSWNPKRDTVTLYYEGDPAVWADAMTKYNNDDYTGMLKQSWDNNMGDGSRVFFLVDGKVDNTQYWELNSNYVWVLHEHAYTYEAAQSCSHGEDSHYEHTTEWNEILSGGSLKENKFTDYAGTCDCDSCNGATRPDAEYWTTDTTG